MRRSAVLAAAAASTVIAVGLVSPAAQAAAPQTKLVGTASCVGGGQIRLTSTLDAGGTAKAIATITGVKQDRWEGLLLAGVDKATYDSISGSLPQMTKYTATHGTVSASATRSGTTSSDAVAVFGDTRGSAVCNIVISGGGVGYLVADANTHGALALNSSRAQAAVQVRIPAERNHRYRASFTVHSKGASHRVSVVKKASKSGLLDIVVRHVTSLPTFSNVSVKVTDLTRLNSKPTTYSIGR